MTFAYTYPGIYIEEVAGSRPTITPAPTSITVFVGYPHQYKTATFNQPVQIFSFADYQRAFGGLYANAWLDSNLAYAVQQFFLNGGGEAYVYGLQAAIYASWTPPVPPASAGDLGAPPQGGPVGLASALTFSGLELVDPSHSISVTISNVTSSVASNDMADLVVSYGSAVETFRRVSLSQWTDAGHNAANPNFVETRVNGLSNLIWVSPPAGASSYAGASFTSQTVTLANPASFNPSGGAAFSEADFTNATNGPFVVDGPLDKVPVFNLMVIPGVVDAGIWAQAIAFCEHKRAFLLLDPPPNYSADGMTPAPPKNLPGIDPLIQSGTLPQSSNAALYFPYLTSIDPLTGNAMRLPPASAVAGVFATIDNNRGVWKAPAGLEAIVNNVTGVVPEGMLTDDRQGVLNLDGVNCLRTFRGIGTVVYGARTTTTQNPAFQQWRYVPVRRMALFIEQTLYANLGWVVFEPNDTPLWDAITATINAFMLTLFHQGAFQGATPNQAFQVTCDSTTTTQADINNGIVNILVAFAPLKPAEFVVIQIQQLAGQAQS
jgi:phage tail sheath protein FI